MEDILINFEYSNHKIQIQCKRKEYMKDILKRFTAKTNKTIDSFYFLYNGQLINENMKLENLNNKDNEIRILVNDINSNNNNENCHTINYLKNIVCPKCDENCFINFNNYKITLNNCSNSHKLENILLSEFNDYQKLYETKIICNICNKNKNQTYENKFYKCYSCNINLCPLCKSIHKQNHLIIDFDLKNYYCIEHRKEKEKYISYCKECNKNLCCICMSDHNKYHTIIYNSKIIINEDIYNNTLNELRQKINIFKT